MSFTKNAVLNFNFSLKIFLEKFNHRKWTLKDQCLDFFELFDQSVKVIHSAKSFFLNHQQTWFEHTHNKFFFRNRIL